MSPNAASTKSTRKKNRSRVTRWLSVGLFLAVLTGVVVSWTRPRAADSLIESDLSPNYVPDSPITTNLNETFPNQENSDEIISAGALGLDCDYANIFCLNNTNTEAWMITALAKTGALKATNSGNVQMGLLQDLTRMIATTYSSPVASSGYYLATLIDNTGLASQTYAQGYGYYSLAPYMQVWKVFRNLVYMLFAVVIIVISFMILFRQRIGNQAAVTAQQALPRIVIALVLVTFSYAIAGFLIDLMYWVMYAFGSIVIVNGSKENIGMLINGGFGTVASNVLVGRADNVFSNVSELAKGFFDQVLWGPVSSFVSWISGILAMVIVMIALLYGLFRILFLLLKSYAAVLLYILFSPFILMLHAIPGNNSFRNWVFQIVANLSPFVMTFFLLIILGVINHYTAGNGDVGFVPPYITGELSTQSVGTIVSLAVLLAMPEILQTIKKKIGGDGGMFEQFGNAAWNNLKGAAKGRTFRTIAGGAAGLGFAGVRALTNRGTAAVSALANRRVNDSEQARSLQQAQDNLAAAQANLNLQKDEQKRVEERASSYASRDRAGDEYQKDLNLSDAELQKKYGSKYDAARKEASLMQIYVDKLAHRQRRADRLRQIAQSKVDEAEQSVGRRKEALTQLKNNRQTSNNATFKQAYDARLAELTPNDWQHFLFQGVRGGARSVATNWVNENFATRWFTNRERSRQFYERLMGEWENYVQLQRFTGGPNAKTATFKEYTEMRRKMYALQSGLQTP